VFLDVEDIEGGEDFVTALEHGIAGADVLLAVIGPRWVTATDETGGRRLDLPHDFVRREIAAALARGLRVIPVLVERAAMPSEKDLPEPLRLLARHQAMEMSDDRWDYDLGRLCKLIEQESGGRSKRWWVAPLTALAVLVIGVAASRWWRAAQQETPAAATPASAATSNTSRRQQDLSGIWLAEPSDARGNRYRLRIQLVQAGSRLAGMVHYATGEGPIEDARREGNALSFTTRHTPQFDSTPARIDFTGTVRDGAIDFVMTSANGTTLFTARREADQPARN